MKDNLARAVALTAILLSSFSQSQAQDITGGQILSPDEIKSFVTRPFVKPFSVEDIVLVGDPTYILVAGDRQGDGGCNFPLNGSISDKSMLSGMDIVMVDRAIDYSTCQKLIMIGGQIAD